MKKRISIIIMYFTFIIGLCIASICSAQGTYYKTKGTHGDAIPYQNDRITANFKIYLDDKEVKSTDYKFRWIMEEDNFDYRNTMSNEFTMFLEYNEQYKFVIGYKGFNTKTIEIDTKAAPSKFWVLECNIYLYSNKPNEYAGKLVYSKETGNFKKI